MKDKQTDRTICMVANCPARMDVRGLCRSCYLVNKETGIHEHIVRIFDLEKAWLPPAMSSKRYNKRVDMLVRDLPASKESKRKFLEHMTARYNGGTHE